MGEDIIMHKALIFGVGLALATLMAGTSAHAGPAEDFYKNRRLTMLVGYGAGAGYDVYARALVRYYEKHIPGNPKFIVKNMPGASSLKMLNYLANFSPRDGSELGAPARGLFMEPLYGNKKAKYDAKTFSFIGSIGKDTPLCFTWHTSGVTSIRQAMKQTVVVGAGGGPSSSNIYPRVLNGIIHTKFKIISGYKGSAGIGLAMERGEVQGYCSFGWTSVKSARANWVKKKQINILLQIAIRKNSELPNVPLVTELVKSKEDLAALRLVFSDTEMARPITGPKNVPADRLKLLRDTFQATMKDPGFVSHATKYGLEVDPISGQEIAALIGRIYATPRKVVERVIQLRPKMK
jgi:tripartite-type tricarboxylate transporter receptor subunit TctC